jgi:hypothetical protein
VQHAPQNPFVKEKQSESMKNRNVTFTTILFALGFLALLPGMQAVVPPPDGGYPGRNTAEGQNALFRLTSGVDNTALGFQALFHNTTGGQNTATGINALLNNTTGFFNTANGREALFDNTTGSNNTAIGVGALFGNTTGNFNTAIGDGALLNNKTGNFNTASGGFALAFNSTGIENTANGVQALFNNTTGNSNTAIGGDALNRNTTGMSNTANGAAALFSNTTGNNNTATGFQALRFNTTGSNNTANGFQALSNSTGFNNVAVGDGAGSGVTNANNVICIGAFLSGLNENNSCFISNIFGAPVGGDAVPVSVDSTGKLGTFTSSRRFKKEIKPMDKVSEAILALKPVTFHYKTNKTNTAQFGLIAEEVAEVNPELVIRDKEGKPYMVRYDAVNAMLLNEFLKEHRKVQAHEATITELKSTVARQQKGMEALTAQLKEQAAQIQKVGTRPERSKPRTRVALNNP